MVYFRENEVPTALNLLALLFENFQLCVQNMGHFSDWIACRRGVHQGCPIAPYLFLVVSQMLNEIIHKNAHVEGLEWGGFHYKIFQYADDTEFILKSKQGVFDIL